MRDHRFAIVSSLASCVAAFAGSGDLPPDPTEPVSIHALAAAEHRDAATNPGLIEGGSRTIVPLQPRPAGTLFPCRTIFGYLPYWENPTPLQWDKLTHVACFSVEVNQTGAVTNLRGWPWTALINDAHQNGVKVILVTTLFDGAKIQTLITTPAYKQTFFNNMKAQMIAGQADGLNIDFEGGTQWQGQINTFMAELSASLKAYNPAWEVTFAGPAVNWNDVWNLPGLAAACDGIFIMGYAFAGSWSTTTGPNAPLIGGSINITNTVDVQYAGVPAGKMILGVPYYGNRWTTSSPNPRASVVSFIGSTRFTNDQPNSQVYGLQWEASSQTPWYRWQSGSQWNQVWFDNAQSLGLKYDLALARDLQGVGMWALGYDEGRQELWDVLADKFGGCGRPCDLDTDGDVDWYDFAFYEYCLEGPDNDYAGWHECMHADLDGDHDVDLADLTQCQSGVAP
jgi:spore germination protein YaaH